MQSVSLQWFSPAFLWALPVAAGLPVAAHLWTRFHAKPVPFASMMFLPPTAAPTARVSRLDHRLLLALRVLALAAFALAFARPAWTGSGERPTPALGGRRVALVMDRTASMNQPEGLGTAFDAARFEADAFLAKLDARDQVAVVTVDRACAPLWAGWLPVAQARAKLNQITPSWEAGDAGKAVEVAQSLQAVRVVVWTDGQGAQQCPSGGEVRVVGKAGDNRWLKKERPEAGEKKPVVDVYGDGEEASRVALALGFESSAPAAFGVQRVRTNPLLALREGNIVVMEVEAGVWEFSEWDRWSDKKLSIVHRSGWLESSHAGPRTIVSADWSTPELAVFEGVSRAALIGSSLSDGVVLKPQSGDRILLRFSDGAPALMALGHGHGFVLAGSPTGGPRPLANSPAFVPLVQELVKALLPHPPFAAHPGDRLDLPVPAGGRTLAPGGEAAGGRFAEPGLYRAVDAKGQTVTTRWCEVDGHETDWARGAPTPQDAAHAAAGSHGTLPELAEPRAPIELWPLLALLALVALLAEPVLIWHAGRRARA